MMPNGMLDFSNLEPGVYQVATPEEMQPIETAVTLRKDDHFWVDEKWEKDENNRWHKVLKGLHTNTTGLLLQGEALGVRVVPRIVQQDRRYVLADATGFRLDAAGMLTVYRRVREYDMAAELFRAALKKLPKPTTKTPNEKPTDAQTKALAQVVEEQTALSLVQTLAPEVQAEVLLARMEVQDHRLALVQTKAENQVLRHFVRRCGGVINVAGDFTEITITLQRAILVRKVTPEHARAAAEALFGPGGPKRVSAEVVNDKQPPLTEAAEVAEEAEVVHEEGAVAEQAEEASAAAAEAEPGPVAVTEQPELEDGAAPDASESQDAGPPEELPMQEAPPAKPGPSESDRKCDCGCGKSVSIAEVNFCESDYGRKRFKGKVYARACQPRFPEKIGLPPGGAR